MRGRLAGSAWRMAWPLARGGDGAGSLASSAARSLNAVSTVELLTAEDQGARVLARPRKLPDYRRRVHSHMPNTLNTSTLRRSARQLANT